MRNVRIVFLSVENRRMRDRPCDSRFPVLGVGTVFLCSPVGEPDFKHTPERAFLAVEPAAAVVRRDDLVAPPSRAHLGGEDVALARLCLHEGGDVVRKRISSLGDMGKTRLEKLVADDAAVDVYLIHAQRRRRPFGRHHILLVHYFAEKPAVSRLRTRIGSDGTRKDGFVHGRNPFRLRKRRCIRLRNQRKKNSHCGILHISTSFASADFTTGLSFG